MMSIPKLITEAVKVAKPFLDKDEAFLVLPDAVSGIRTIACDSNYRRQQNVAALLFQIALRRLGN
jgi:hypothetical protein